GAGVVGHRFAGLDRRAEHARLGADRQRIIALETGSERHEASVAVAPGERPGAPRRLAAASVGDDPDLEQRGGFVLEIVLGVLDARPGRHDLHVAGRGAPGIAEAVLVRDRALPDVRYDLHVAVRMRREAGPRSDLVVVPHPALAPVGPRRVVVVGEGEMRLRVEPAVVGTAGAGKRPEFDHRRVRSGYLV